MMFPTKRRRGHRAASFFLRRHVLICCMASLLMMLCACGGHIEPSASVPNPPPTSQTQPAAATEPENHETPSTPTETEAGPNPSDTANYEPGPNSNDVAEVGPSDEGVETPAEPKPTPEETQNLPKTPASNEIKGLILMTTISKDEFSVFSFDPTTGVQTAISTFRCEDSTPERELFFDGSVGFLLDQTCTKRCVSCTITSTTDKHAGWITTDGEFFDVTEKVGLARQGDFGQRVNHAAAGFTDDGYYLFRAFGDKSSHTKDTTYYVPVNDVRPETLKEGAPDGIGFDNALKPTIAMGDGRCLGVKGGTCVIFSNLDDGVHHRNPTNFIPQSDRENWSPVASPNEQQVAFVSKPKRGTEPADIFIVPISGGDPVRVPSHDFTMDNSELYYFGKTILIDWR